MKKLFLSLLAIALLMSPGLIFSQEVIIDTTKTDTIQKQIPDSLQLQKPQKIKKKRSDDKATAEVKITNYGKGWGVSLKASTLGFGLEFIRRHNQFLAMRLGATYFPYKHSKTDTEFEVLKKYTTDFGAVTLIADWFVIGHFSTFHLSGGLVYNNTYLTMKGRPVNTYKIGTYVIPMQQLGDIEIKVKPNKFSPYLGAGFGNFISAKKRITFNVQLGVLYQAPPKIEFIATGMIEPTAEQIDIVEHNVEGFIFYPVLDLQIVYRLNRIK